MRRKGHRRFLMAAPGAVLVAATELALSAVSGSKAFFRSPSEIAVQRMAVGERFRLGGLVQRGPVNRCSEQPVADSPATVPVMYRGLLPDLFREGQDVVEGALDVGGTYYADTVLARHDATDMPRTVAGALKPRGHRQGGEFSTLA
ncbi:Cytochrome c-type biogenesis protein CcmE [Methylobacterium brachiatum]|nr:Cytochrome c-type biogenesis protein CcmE [Methylobacterium brachiatum]